MGMGENRRVALMGEVFKAEAGCSLGYTVGVLTPFAIFFSHFLKLNSSGLGG